MWKRYLNATQENNNKNKRRQNKLFDILLHNTFAIWQSHYSTNMRMTLNFLNKFPAIIGWKVFSLLIIFVWISSGFVILLLHSCCLM